MSYAVFDGSYTTVTATGAYIHDYGQELKIVGLDLPPAVEAHFSLERSGRSVLSVGTCENRVATIPIPDEMLEEAGSFFCYIFGRTDGAGRTQYEIKIPVTGRSGLPTETANPTEGDIAYFDSVIAEMEAILNQAVEMKNAILNGLRIGEVETLEAGSEATAAITDDSGSLALNLGIPKGEKGDESEPFVVRITVPGSNQEPVADKTYVEIQAALKAGKRVYVYAPKAQFTFFKFPDGPFEPDTVYELLWPTKETTVDGTAKKYAFFGYSGIIADKKLTTYLEDYETLIEGYAVYSDGTVESRAMRNNAGNTFLGKTSLDLVPTEGSQNPVMSGGVYDALNYKVTISTEIGDESKISADVSYADLKAAFDAGKRPYAEVKFFTDVQDESTYTHSIILPFAYESIEEEYDEIAFAYYGLYDSGPSHDFLSGQMYFASIFSGNGMSFGVKSGLQIPKKSTLDALAQRIEALEQAVGNT